MLATFFIYAKCTTKFILRSHYITLFFLFSFLPNETLSSIPLPILANPVQNNYPELNSRTEQSYTIQPEDSPPDYKTVIEMKEDEENLPTYSEAVSTNILGQSIEESVNFDHYECKIYC